MIEQSPQLAAALDRFVQASDAAEAAPGDRQAARRAIEAATVVAQLARRAGFGAASTSRGIVDEEYGEASDAGRGADDA
jgi:hypothetical protein